MTITRKFGGSCVIVVLMGVSPALGQPEAVSPGAEGEAAFLDQKCATFSWAAVPRSLSYELAVYSLEPDLKGIDSDDPVWTKRLSGSVTSFTASGASCLSSGQYAWAVRADVEGKGAEWSQPLLFEVSAPPPMSELQPILDLLRDRRALGEAVIRTPIAAAERPVSVLPRTLAALSANFEGSVDIEGDLSLGGSFFTGGVPWGSLVFGFLGTNNANSTCNTICSTHGMTCAFAFTSFGVGKSCSNIASDIEVFLCLCNS